MSDVTEDAATSMTEPINGKPYTFTFLNIYDRAELLRTDRKRRREQLASTLKDAGVAPSDIVATLHEFDDQSINDQTWIDFVNSSDHDYEIYRLSLSTKHGAEADAMAKLPIAAASIQRKAKICGLDVVAVRSPDSPNAETQPEGSPPNPTMPLVYEKPGSGTGSTIGA